jgi:ankyrin repeat protein
MSSTPAPAAAYMARKRPIIDHAHQKQLLMQAIIVGDLEAATDVMYTMERHQVSFDMQDHRGHTALMITLSTRHNNVDRFGSHQRFMSILCRNSNAEIKDENGNNGWHYTARSGITYVASGLKPLSCSGEINNDGLTPLHVAVLEDSPNYILMKLCERRQNVIQRDRRGWTALHHAVHLGNERIVRYLLKWPEVYDTPDNNCDTPFMLSKDNPAIHRIFLEHAAKFEEEAKWHNL